MLRTLISAGIIAVAGLGLAPAIASAEPFKNCSAARDAGYENITADSEYYGEHLDSDLDGVGCES